jgi:hypothetical protein
LIVTFGLPSHQVAFLVFTLIKPLSFPAKRGKSLDNMTMQLSETRLMHLEEFEDSQGDSATLFGVGTRPFMAVTIMRFLRKYNLEECKLEK